jgi:hypothetical protein
MKKIASSEKFSQGKNPTQEQYGWCDDDGVLWFPIETLMAESGLRRRQCRKSINELRRAGLLETKIVDGIAVYRGIVPKDEQL